jgi:hypothetical protein
VLPFLSCLCVYACDVREGLVMCVGCAARALGWVGSVRCNWWNVCVC